MAFVVQTHSGVLWDVMKPNPADVRLEDIAWSLDRQNRFNGHTSAPYTVADHSVWVGALLAGTEAEIYGYLHDAHEAFLSDIPSPVKMAIRALTRGLDPIKDLENRADKAIYAALGLRSPSVVTERAVKEADERAMDAEGAAFLGWPLRETLPPCRHYNGRAGDIWLRKVEKLLA